MCLKTSRATPALQLKPLHPVESRHSKTSRIWQPLCVQTRLADATPPPRTIIHNTHSHTFSTHFPLRVFSKCMCHSVCPLHICLTLLHICLCAGMCVFLCLPTCVCAWMCESLKWLCMFFFFFIYQCVCVCACACARADVCVKCELNGAATRWALRIRLPVYRAASVQPVNHSQRKRWRVPGSLRRKMGFPSTRTIRRRTGGGADSPNSIKPLQKKKFHSTYSCCSLLPNDIYITSNAL